MISQLQTCNKTADLGGFNPSNPTEQINEIIRIYRQNNIYSAMQRVVGFSDEERDMMAYALYPLARLPETQRILNHLKQRFSALTGFTVFGAVTNTQAPFGNVPKLVTVDIRRRSRSLPSGPMVFTSVPVEHFNEPLPPCVTDLAKENKHFFDELRVLKPVLRRVTLFKKKTLYYESISQMPRCYRPPQTIDPILVGSFNGFSNELFSLAHWD